MLVDFIACDVGRTKNDAAKEYGSGFVCKKCFNLAATYLTLMEKLRNKLQETFRLRIDLARQYIQVDKALSVQLTAVHKGLVQ